MAAVQVLTMYTWCPPSSLPPPSFPRLLPLSVLWLINSESASFDESARLKIGTNKLWDVPLAELIFCALRSHAAICLCVGTYFGGEMIAGSFERGDPKLHSLLGVPLRLKLISGLIIQPVRAVFGRRVSHTERAHLAGDCGAGGGQENRSPEKQAKLRAAGLQSLHAHLRDGGVQHGGVPAEARRLHTAARPPGHERESTELLIRTLPFQRIQLARRSRGHRA
ncbi:unnamed protein product [Pleuronectes platessa]|uniref:Uncharacterized protein n=1 Tax=Pleuronectes platessa TaxID=8262 RepID=A0A9N7YAS3_PLEPL|nr:unnamed protein product [Pleuronectes platessa]